MSPTPLPTRCPLRYCGAKYALLGWFDALRLEEHAMGSGLRVTNVCPGSVRTNVARNALMATADERRGRSDPNIESGLPVDPTLATHATWLVLKAGETACQTGELPKTL